jgi:hypothetical protein
MRTSLSRWLPVLLMVVVIYTTIPVVRRLREWFAALADPSLITWLVTAVIVAAAGAGWLLGRRGSRHRRPGSTLWIGAVCALLVAWTFTLRSSPEEAVHLIEYGGLAVLVHRALRPTVPDALVFVAGALLGSMVGTIDEIIQWLVPDRYWDWRDIALNAGAGALVQLVLWRVEPGPRSPVSVGSVRFVLRLAAVQAALIALCLANTPTRVAWYAPHLPGGATLLRSHNPMAEYGHRHTIDGLGVIFSRLTLSELAAQDAARGAEVGALVDEWRHRYGEFLDVWPYADDPFTYEFRVHLFARDRNLAKARERGFSGGAAVEQATVAWFENRVVGELFSSSFAHSSYRWPPRFERRVDSIRDPDHRFVSAAGSHLITVASEEVVVGCMVVLSASLLVASGLVGRYHRTRS